MPPPEGTNRWLIVAYNHAWPTFNGVTDENLYITLETDVPVHLFCCFTDKPLRVHDKMDVHRGFGFKWDPHYCFVMFDCLEQEEPGDTILHHFRIPNWHHCLTLWWIFIGTIGGLTSWSSSPVFNAHYLDYTKDESMRHLDLTDKEIAGVIDHADGSVTPAKLSFAVPQVIATYQGLDLGSHLIEWTGEWRYITVRLSMAHQFNSFIPLMRLNEETDPIYGNVYIYTHPTSGPTRISQPGLTNFVLYPTTVPNGEAASYLAHFSRGPLGSEYLHATYQAHVRYFPDTYVLQGHLLFGYNIILNSIRISSLGADLFNLQAVITGLNP